MNDLNVNILIVNYGDQTSMAVECLKSVFKFHPELEERTIIVDNASKNNGVEQFKKFFPKARIVPSKSNLGLSKAINWGVYNSNQKYVLYLNNDILVQSPNTIPAMVQYLNQDQSVALLAPKLVNRDGSTQLSCFRFPTISYVVYRRTGLGKLPFAKKTLNRIMMKDFDHETTQEVDWILGAAMMIRREAMHRVGMMDERYFLYFEDVDLCRRFHEANFKVVYFPQETMIHYHLRESDSAINPFSALLNRLTRVHISSGFKYFYKYSGLRSKRVKNSTLQALRADKYEQQKIKHQEL